MLYYTTGKLKKRRLFVINLVGEIHVNQKQNKTNNRTFCPCIILKNLINKKSRERKKEKGYKKLTVLLLEYEICSNRSLVLYIYIYI